MNEFNNILKRFKEGKILIEEAEKLLRANLIECVGDVAKLDIFRKTRTGIPEVIFAQNKDPQMLKDIINSFLKRNKFAIVSRFSNEQKEILLKHYDKNENYILEINEYGKILIIREKTFEFIKGKGIIGIISAGSSDISVAEEAKMISKAMGCEVLTSYDVGVAGFHRIFTPLSEMIKKGVHVIIVCAGMEGTLPGVVAALVDVPVIGVPTSTGYGMGEKGIGALTTMLQSCSPGLLVVNIDNGFGAGASAALIANKIGESKV